MPVKPIGHLAVVGAAIPTQHSQRDRFLLCSWFDEHALFAFKHFAHCGSLKHSVLVRGVTLELTYRQLTA
ncbi:MAG TPA: hypothetical protein VF742_16270 [Terracidiphilus sp.]